MGKELDWVVRGKTIRQLIKELQTFDDQDLEVLISTDGGVTRKCISLVSKRKGTALLENCEDPSVYGDSECDKFGK